MCSGCDSVDVDDTVFHIQRADFCTAGTHSREIEEFKGRVVDYRGDDYLHCLSAYDWILNLRDYYWLRLWVSDRV